MLAVELQRGMRVFVGAVVLAYLGLMGAWLIQAPERGSWVLATLPFLTELAVVVCGFHYLGVHRRESRLIGLGIGLIGLGDLLWAWHGFRTGLVYATGVASGPLWFLGHVFVAVGVLRLAGKRVSRTRMPLLIDSLVAAGVLTYFIWRQQESTAHTYLMPSLMEAIGFYGSGIAEIIWLLAGLILLQPGEQRRVGFRDVGLGALTIALFDNFFAQDVSAHLRPGGFYLLGNCMGYVLFARGLWRLEREPASEASREQISVGTPFFPYLVALLFCGAMMAHSLLRQRHIHWELEAGLMALSALLVARLAVLMVENQRLSCALQRSHDRLEEAVAHRTRQLSLLHAYALALGEATSVEELHTTALRYGNQLLEPVALAYSDHTPPGAVAVPVSDSGTHYTTLVAARPEGEFSKTDQELLENLARFLGVALTRMHDFARVREQADRDPMTSLLNHRAAMELLQQRLSAARLQQETYAILMLDVNSFKLFNDTYGHPVGDAVLRRIAQALGESVPEQAILARYGGDEFIIGVASPDPESLTHFAEQVNANLHATPLDLPAAKERIPVSVSCGMALFPQEGERLGELIEQADRRLFEAKDRGEVFSTSYRPPLRLITAEADPGIMDTLQAMLTAVDNKDRYTRAHSEDVTAYALWLAEGMGVSLEQQRILRLAAMLHDIGKIGVADDILRKPGHLTEAEFAAMKMHTTLGALIVAAMPGLEKTIPVVRSHHERWDGKGYPDGTEGEETPLLARIVAVADAFSAMTTSRPYRRARDWDSALAEIYKGAGTQFDPTLARVFVTVMRQYLKEEEGRRAA